MQHEVTDEMRNLEVSVYSLETLTDTLSKGRVRIFYKGLNRNHTYISDAFADELIASLPYTPIKGIFDEEEMDYEDHGWNSRQGKIYGIVPENPNFAWEEFEDEDGITREYACTDVYLFTSLYPEAKLIVDKGQSMEIYENSVEGHWVEDENGAGEYYEFDHGSLLGLQILGDKFEPCFEGAAFYSLSENIQELLSYIKDYNDAREDEGMEEEKSPAEISMFEVIERKEDKGICFDADSKQYVFVQFLEDESIEEISRTESLYSAIEKLVNEIDNLKETITKYEETAIQKDNLEKDSIEAMKIDFEAQLKTKEEEIFRLHQERDNIINEKSKLELFKKNVDVESKKKILEEFSEYLSTSQISEYTDKMDEFSVDDFRKELCVLAYDSGHMNTSKELVYKLQDNEKNVETGALRLLNKYKKGGNR